MKHKFFGSKITVLVMHLSRIRLILRYKLQKNLLNLLHFTNLDSKHYFENSELMSELESILESNNVSSVLEIGTFEGIFTINLAKIDSVKEIITLDPFTVGDPTNSVNDAVERNFFYNLTKSPNRHKITHFKLTSDAYFQVIGKKQFDFIYVDGSHDPNVARRDLQNAWKCCKVNGIIWIDDYGSKYSINGLSLTDEINNFVLDKKESVSIIHKNYQLGIKKLI